MSCHVVTCQWHVSVTPHGVDFADVMTQEMSWHVTTCQTPPLDPVPKNACWECDQARTIWGGSLIRTKSSKSTPAGSKSHCREVVRNKRILGQANSYSKVGYYVAAAATRWHRVETSDGNRWTGKCHRDTVPTLLESRCGCIRSSILHHILGKIRSRAQDEKRTRPRLDVLETWNLWDTSKFVAAGGSPNRTPFCSASVGEQTPNRCDSVTVLFGARCWISGFMEGPCSTCDRERDWVLWSRLLWEKACEYKLQSNVGRPQLFFQYMWTEQFLVWRSGPGSCVMPTRHGATPLLVSTSTSLNAPPIQPGANRDREAPREVEWPSRNSGAHAKDREG